MENIRFLIRGKQVDDFAVVRLILAYHGESSCNLIWCGSIGGTLGVTGAISGASINTGSGAMTFDQGVKTTDSPTFASINTGQGPKEIWGMNQDVATDSTVHFANLNPPVDNNDNAPPAIGVVDLHT